MPEIGGISAGIWPFSREFHREFGNFRIPEIPALFREFHKIQQEFDIFLVVVVVLMLLLLLLLQQSLA